MIWIAIVGSAIATYLTRSLPFAVTLGGRLPPAATRYLEALPVAIIAALVGPAVIAPAGALTHGAEPVAAALVVATVAWRRSLLAGVIVGVVAVALLRLV
ncbi:MAG TPA: AzlD domain-containing protein [Candidatus Limnocylindria bacterium]|jgi:branched-subunit amino acid transport protein